MSDFISQKHLILASGSLSRRQLLNSLGLQFEVIPSNCDEEEIKKSFPNHDFTSLARTLAAHKGLNVSVRYPNSYVIAADQLCVQNDLVFDKPQTHDLAMKHLQLLHGKTHLQISACCIVKAGNLLWQSEDSAYLTMKKLSNQAIDAYLRHDMPYQSCGAYHFEGKAKWLFSEVKGSDSTIQGLPLIQLTTALVDLGIVSFSQ